MSTVLLLAQANHDFKTEDQQVFTQATPIVGDRVSMGADPRWEVVEVLTYQGENSQLNIATVAPTEAEVPPKDDWAFYGSAADGGSFYLILDGGEDCGMGFIYDSRALPTELADFEVLQAVDPQNPMRQIYYGTSTLVLAADLKNSRSPLRRTGGKVPSPGWNPCAAS